MTITDLSMNIFKNSRNHMRTKTVLLGTIGFCSIHYTFLNSWNLYYFCTGKKDKLEKKKQWPQGNETYVEYQINQHNHTIVSQSIHKPGYAFPKRTRTWNIKKQIKGNWHIFSHFN